MTDWNSAPKIAGEMFDQSKRQASSSAARMVALNGGMRSGPSNNLPLTYGKRARSSSSVSSRSPSGVFSTWNASESRGPRSTPSSPVRVSMKSRKTSRCSKMPVSSANRQKTVRAKKRSRSWPR